MTEKYYSPEHLMRCVENNSLNIHYKHKKAKGTFFLWMLHLIPVMSARNAQCSDDVNWKKAKFKNKHDIFFFTI